VGVIADAWVRVGMRSDPNAAGKLRQDLNADATKAGESAGQAAGESFAHRMNESIKNLVSVAALATGLKAAASGIKETTEAASNLEETSSKVSVIFGKEAVPALQAFAAEAQKSMGQSKQAALDGLATFAVFGKGAGLAGNDLIGFSSGLSKLASDMASFSNTTPEEAIEALGAALRGESDPIEKYGVLLNDANLKARAVSLGLADAGESTAKIADLNIKAEKAQRNLNDAVKKYGEGSFQARDAANTLAGAQNKLAGAVDGTISVLTPQQRVLAAQAEIMAQTSDAQGDFIRTSSGLANQQRIASAGWENLKSTLGELFLPVLTQVISFINTNVLPALQNLATQYGPQIEAWLGSAGAKAGEFADKLKGFDFGDAYQRLKDVISNLGPAFQQIQADSGPFFKDTLEVGKVVVGFLADNVDKLGDALPWLIAGLIGWKIAQGASNVVAAISPIITLGDIFAKRALAKANLELAATLAGNTAAITGNTAATGLNAAATSTGFFGKVKDTIATVAHGVAVGASKAAMLVATAAQWAWNAALNANPIGLVVLAIAALVAGFIYAWTHSETFRKIIIAAWEGIQTAALWAWDNVLKPVFDFIVNGIKGWAAAATWLWQEVIQPVFGFIGDKAKWLWSNVLSPVIDFIINGIKGWAAAFTWLWQEVIQPSLSFIGDKIRWLWDNVISPVFQFIRDALGKVGDAFRDTADFIGRVWSTIKDAAMNPVKFVVDVVYNNGIRKVWNGIADLFGLGQLPAVTFADGGQASGGGGRPMMAMAAGGFLRGPGGPREDKIPAMLSNGEFVVNASATARSLPLLEAINKGTVPGFADGGIAGWIRDKFTGVGNGLEAFGNHPFMQALKAIPGKAVDGIMNKINEWLSSAGPAGTGSYGAGVEQWAPLVLQVLAMLGQSASLLPNVLRRMNQESGGNPNAINLWDSNAAAGIPSKGLMQTIDPTFNAYAGPFVGRGVWDPLANIYAGLNYAIHAYPSLQYAMDKPGGYDNGGWLPPGSGRVFNGTRSPEAVLDPEESRAFIAMAKKGFRGGGDRTYIINGADADEVLAKVRARDDWDAEVGSL